MNSISNAEPMNLEEDDEEQKKRARDSVIQLYTNSETWYPLVHHRAKC